MQQGWRIAACYYAILLDTELQTRNSMQQDCKPGSKIRMHGDITFLSND